MHTEHERDKTIDITILYDFKHACTRNLINMFKAAIKFAFDRSVYADSNLTITNITVKEDDDPAGFYIALAYKGAITTTSLETLHDHYAKRIDDKLTNLQTEVTKSKIAFSNETDISFTSSWSVTSLPPLPGP